MYVIPSHIAVEVLPGLQGIAQADRIGVLRRDQISAIAMAGG